MASPTNAPKPENPDSVANRLGDLKARLGDPALTRKPYRLSLVSSKEKPCPGWAPTIGGQAFHRKSSTVVENEMGKDETVTNEGIVVYLTDAEASTLRERMKDYIIRWRNRGAFIAEFLDARNTGIQLNPETDELAEPYLSMRPVAV